MTRRTAVSPSQDTKSFMPTSLATPMRPAQLSSSSAHWRRLNRKFDHGTLHCVNRFIQEHLAMSSGSAKPPFSFLLTSTTDQTTSS